MRIVVRCKCRQKVAVKSKYAGREVTCPKCQQPILVPQSDSEPELLSDDDLWQSDQSELIPPSKQFPPPAPHPSRFHSNQPSYDKHRPSIVSLPAILSGVLSMIVGLIHLLVSAGFGLQTIQVYRMHNAMSARMHGFGANVAQEAFNTSVLYFLFLCLAVLVMAMIQISGAMGLFFSKIFGWILSIISAGLSFAFSGYLIYTSLTVSQASRIVSPNINQQHQQMVSEMTQSFTLTLYFFAALYILYAIFTISLLCNGGTLRVFFKR